MKITARLTTVTNMTVLLPARPISAANGAGPVTYALTPAARASAPRCPGRLRPIRSPRPGRLVTARFTWT